MTFVSQVIPDFKSRLKLYQDEVPLLNRYQIESQIETAIAVRPVRPPSSTPVADST